MFGVNQVLEIPSSNAAIGAKTLSDITYAITQPFIKLIYGHDFNIFFFKGKFVLFL